MPAVSWPITVKIPSESKSCKLSSPGNFIHLFFGAHDLWPMICCLLRSISLHFVILYLGPILPRRATFSDCSRCVLYLKNSEKRQRYNELKVTVNLSEVITLSTFFWTPSTWKLCPLRVNLSLKTWQKTHLIWLLGKNHPQEETSEQTRSTVVLVSEDTFKR